MGYTWGGEKLEAKGGKPHTVGYFDAASKQPAKLPLLLYGEECRDEQMGALSLKHLRKFHGEMPELFTARFILEAWSRMRLGYCEAARDGIRPPLRTSRLVQ